MENNCVAANIMLVIITKFAPVEQDYNNSKLINIFELWLLSNSEKLALYIKFKNPTNNDMCQYWITSS